MIPRGEGLSGRAVWAEVAAGGDRRALTSPRTTRRSRHCGAPAQLPEHPPGAPRYPGCAMAKATDVWSDLVLVFWFACLLPLGPVRVAAGKSEPAWSCPVLPRT